MQPENRRPDRLPRLRSQHLGNEPSIRDIHGATWRICFRSPRFTLGTWVMRPESAGYERLRAVEQHALVFPRFVNWIRFSGHTPFVADPHKILAFNRAQVYSRTAIHPQGDLGYLFLPGVELLDTILSSRGRTGPSAEYRPFNFSSVAADHVSILLQRKVFDHLENDEDRDELLIEEASIEILNRTFDSGTSDRGTELAENRQTEIAERVRATMGQAYWENISLSEIAQRVAVSIYHLSRVFRHVTGLTLHAYREELRLREGAYRISEGERDLSTLALDLGYSSHSHFTNRFRTRFGLTPSDFRDRPPTAQIRRILST